MLVLCMFLCSCPYVSIFESLISNFYDPDLYVRCSDIFLCSYPNFKFEKKTIVAKYNGGFPCMHACVSASCVPCVSFLHLYSNFKFKKIDCSTFSMVMRVGFYALKHLYAHIPMFLYTRPYVYMLDHLSILVSLGFYAHVKL